MDLIRPPPRPGPVTMISFVIPAYNEQALLGGTIDALVLGAGSCGVEHEIVVVDDASEDRTAEVARAAGARVVSVRRRQIAAVRNAGARAARGEVLVFVDADTRVPAATLRGTIEALERGAVGGGARLRFDRETPLAARAVLRVFTRLYFALGWAAGCYLFARRAAFERAGGFDERYYASEEIHLSRALARLGRFEIVRDPVVTSGRKARLYSTRELLATFLRMSLGFPRTARRRKGLDVWYDGRR